MQGKIGRTEASLRAARAYLYATAAEAWRDLIDIPASDFALTSAAPPVLTL